MPTKAPATAPMPELFKIEENNPLFSAGNVYDGATMMVRYCQFLQNRVSDDPDDLGLWTALHVVTDAMIKLRDCLDAHREAVLAWKEAQNDR